MSSITSELKLSKRSFWVSPKNSLEVVFPIDKERESFEDTVEDNNIQKQVEEHDYYEVPITWCLLKMQRSYICLVKQVSYILYQEAVDVWMDEILAREKVKSR